jgi:DNA-binding IclR family transcriptional regulator
VQSLTRFTAVLDALASTDRPMSVLEIAGESGLDRAVVNRMVKALVEEEFVERDRAGRYRMGPRAMVYASAYIDVLAVRRIGLPYAVELRERLGRDLPAVVSLNIRVVAEMTVVDAVWDNKIGLDSILQVGTRFPVERSASGRCVLAYLGEESRRALLGARLTPELERRLADVRAAGGVDSTQGDFRAGIIGLGATIFDSDREPVAALTLYGSEPGVEGLADTGSEIAVALRRTADAIGFAVGGPRSQSLPGS